MCSLTAVCVVLVVSAQGPAVDLPVTRLSGGSVPPPAAASAAPDEGPPPALALTRLDESLRAADLDAPRRVSLSFAARVPIADVLLLLVRDTPFSVAMDADVAGSFIGELKDVTMREAFESVLRPRGLAFEARGPVIHVFAPRPESRLFDLNFLDVRRTWTRSIAGGEPDGEAAGELKAASGSAGVLDGVAAGIAALLSPEGRVHVDRRAGLAQVTDYAERLERVGLYIEALHLRAAREVRLQARVLEVRLRNGASIDWRPVREALGVREASPEAGIPVADPAALQSALAAQGDVRVVAAPDVVALNNEPVIVRAGAPDASSVTLTVIAQISSDGFVQLSVSPTWRERTGTARSDGGTTPLVRVSEADTVLRVLDGRTAMIAGLLRTEDTTRPAAGFTGIFAAQEKPSLHTELVVLLTPTIVTAGTQGMHASR